MVLDRLHLMGRRNFLQTLAGLGVSSSAVQHMTKDDLEELTGDPTDQVPRLSRLKRTGETPLDPDQAPEREPVYYTIDGDEWEIHEGSLQAASELEERLNEERPGRYEVSVSTRTVNHSSRRVVAAKRVGARTGSDDDLPHIDDVRGELPETVSQTLGTGRLRTEVDGIPLVLEEERQEALAEECVDVDEDAHYNDYYRAIAGGMQFEADKGRCTLGIPAYDHDRGENRMVTVNHCFDETGHVFQPRVSDDVRYYAGSVDKTPESDDYEGDLATIDVTPGDRDIHNAIANENTPYTIPFSGTVGLDELNDNVGNSDYPVYVQGRASGRYEDTLTGVRPGSGGDLGNVELGFTASPGDSGASIWTAGGRYPHPYAIGVVQRRKTTGRGGAAGTIGAIMAVVEEELNLSV